MEVTYNSPDEMLKRGMECLDSEDRNLLPEAFNIFNHALTHFDRPNAGLIFSIGVVFMRQGLHGLAEHLFWRALTVNEEVSKNTEMEAAICNNLGYIMNLEGRYQEAQERFERAIEIDPDRSEYYNNMATRYVNAGMPNECLAAVAKALEKDPQNRDAQWNAGLAHLELGNWEKGWEGYRMGLKGDHHSSQVRKRRHYKEKEAHPYWDGTKDKKLSVVVYGEQGVGDEILATSVLAEMAEDVSIVYEAHPRLVNIMRYNFPQFPVYGTRKVPWRELQFPQWHDLDAKCPIFDACGYYRKRDEDFPRVPYLKPFPEKVEKYRELMRSLGDRPKIGISWKGGSTLTRHDLRSFPLSGWVDLFRSVDVDWISLQYDPADKPDWNNPIVEGFQNEFGINLHHDPQIVNDLDECYAGYIQSLDLVISVNTSLVHACGAFGVPCWTLTPSRPAWRYNVPGAVSVGDDRMIWYGDHVRQIRQKGDDWGAVMETVQADLKTYLRERKAA